MVYAINNEIEYAEKNNLIDAYQNYFDLLKINIKVYSIRLCEDRDFYLSIYPETIPDLFFSNVSIKSKIATLFIFLHLEKVVIKLLAIYQKYKNGQ